jgi:hypothetical protein
VERNRKEGQNPPKIVAPTEEEEEEEEDEEEEEGKESTLMGSEPGLCVCVCTTRFKFRNC